MQHAGSASEIAYSSLRRYSCLAVMLGGVFAGVGLAKERSVGRYAITRSATMRKSRSRRDSLQV